MGLPLSARQLSREATVNMGPDRKAVSVQVRPAAGQRLAPLDGLRGIAILLVLLFHFFSLDPAKASTVVVVADRYLRLGWAGVNLFFVLSGFLITGILLDSKAGPHYFRNFYARRVLRIFPLYYGYLFAALTLGRVFSYYGSATLRLEALHQVWLWTYTSNLFEALRRQDLQFFRHFWSLAVEEQFYLFWPLVVFLLPRRALAWFSVGGVLTGVSARIFLKLASGDGFAGLQLFMTPCHVDALSLGALAAIALRTERAWRLAVKGARVAFPLLLAAICVLIGKNGQPSEVQAFPAHLSINSMVNLCSASLLVLAVASSGRTVLRRLLCARPLTFLGKYSYGLYVLHPTVVMVVSSFVTPRSLAVQLHSYFLAGGVYVCVLFLVSIGVAYLSWHAYEARFLKLKRYFEPRRVHAAVVQL